MLAGLPTACHDAAMDTGVHAGRVRDGGSTPQPSVLPPPRWWQRQPVPGGVGALVAVVLLAASLFSRGHEWHWSLGLPTGASVQLTQSGLMPLVALLLMPLMPQVSYRKRDALLVGLVPLVGPMLTGILVSRLLSLPRREWPPRPDETARVVPVPGEPCAYLLMPSFGVAEALRTAWCTDPDHHHPYPSRQATRPGPTRR